MPHVFKIDPEKRLILQVFSGDITVDEIKYVMMETSLDENFDPDFDGISDFLDCEFLFTSEEQDQLVELFERVFAGGEGRSAVLLPASSDASTTAKSHAKQVKDVREMRVYDNPDEALEWLGYSREDITIEQALISYPGL